MQVCATFKLGAEKKCIKYAKQPLIQYRMKSQIFQGMNTFLNIPSKINIDDKTVLDSKLVS